MTERVHKSLIIIPGYPDMLSKFYVDRVDCAGCRLTQQRERHLKASAPSRGGPAVGGSNRGPLQPSTTGYSYFGERFDSDICTTMPASWPHRFTCMTNFCDRHTAEFFLAFMVAPSSAEVVGALSGLEDRVKHRLRDGKVTLWYTDNDMAFEGAMKTEVAQELIARFAERVPHESDTNPVAERMWGTVEPGIKRCLGFADKAPSCLWSWAAAQMEHVLYFISTRAHEPPKSPYEFSHPDGEPADMSWAEPMFCDVVVHLAKRDVDNKLSYSSAEGTYLGHDFKRSCQIVYLPSLQRIGHFHVRMWIRGSFENCKGITADTPVQYRDPDDLFYSEATAAYVPGRYAFKRTADTGSVANDVASAARIQAGVEQLLSTDPAEVEAALVEELIEENRELESRLNHVRVDTDFEVVLIGSEVARAAVSSHSKLVKIETLGEAMASPHWLMIKAGMEDEIAGKVANGFAKVVKDEGQRRVKVKWVINIWLAEDGSITKVKCRLVGCGYSQVKGEDFDKTSAPTLPGPSYRLFCSLVADEDLETDQIDAIKAFTQADLDYVIHSNMPDGFAIEGHLLELCKGLEGLKQCANLWFKKNRWAWNKCNMFADELIDPNFFTYNGPLTIAAVVFVDDVGAAFLAAQREQYLRVRVEYSKLIRIDSPGPDLTVPISTFIGTEWERDRQARTLKITQKGYCSKLARRFDGKLTMNEMPFGATKSKRDDFENMPTGTEETAIDRLVYLEATGSIGWPAVMTRPEIAYTYSVLSSFSMHPLQVHYDACLHTIGYLVNTANLGIVYGGRLIVPLGLSVMPTGFDASSGLWGSTDSSFGKKPRPHGGHAAFRCNGCILWSAKAMKIIVDSTCESETAQGSKASKDMMFLKALLRGIRRPVFCPVTITGDNSAMHALVEKDGASHRTRYFERATMFVKWAILKFIIVLSLVRSEKCVADIFTKAVDQDTFLRMRSVLLNSANDGESTAAVARARRLIVSLGHTMKRVVGV